MRQKTLNIYDFGFSILQVETQSLCNMNCAFCCYPIREDKGLTLADEMVYGLIDTFRGAQGLEYLCLSQFNEPLMDHRIFDFIKYSMQKGISIQIITNGTLFSSKQIIHKL